MRIQLAMRMYAGYEKRGSALRSLLAETLFGEKRRILRTGPVHGTSRIVDVRVDVTNVIARSRDGKIESGGARDLGERSRRMVRDGLRAGQRAPQ